MGRSEFIFTSFDILIPYKNIAAVLTVVNPTISLVNHKSVFCQKKIERGYTMKFAAVTIFIFELQPQNPKEIKSERANYQGGLISVSFSLKTRHKV